MITIETKLIEKVTEIIYNIINGNTVDSVKLPEYIQDNEFKQMVEYFNKFIKEYNNLSEFMHSLSNGNLDFNPPKSKLKFMQSLKNLHANLKHLTWKTEQIATGDLNQKVDFMGNFSKAFNSMTFQLKESFEKIKEKNKQLKEANKEKEKLINTKNRLFKIIAHDLKGLLYPIIGFSEVLKEHCSNSDKCAEQKEWVSHINKSSNASYKLLNDLLDWAKIQTDEIIFKPESTNIRMIVEETVSLLNELANQKQIKIKNSVEESALSFVDKNMLNTVLRNLISNAIKFTHTSGTVTVESIDKNDTVEIIISDTGVGIPPENLSKLFDMSSKYSTIGTKGEKGTGLGLILCKEFIEKNNGSINVKSEVDKGTKFIIELPKE